MKASFKVEGLAELDKQLERLKPATGKAALRRAGNKALKPMAAAAQANAPVLTGDLKQSIKVATKATNSSVEQGKKAFGEVLRAGGSRAEARGALRDTIRSLKAAGLSHYVELYMGPEKAKTRKDAIKAIVQEFGSRKMAANPYMRPAWDSGKNALLERLKSELRTEIDKTIARAAKAGRLIK